MRRPLALTLVLAFLLALLAPVQAAWSCPDGTPCVQDRHQGFVCSGDKCAEEASSCCVVKTTRCKHGAAPVVSAERHGAQIQAPDHCRFSISAAPPLTALAESARLLQVSGEGSLPVPAFKLTLSSAPPVWRSEFTLGYRPPPMVSSGPSRAPPFA